jgi:hypothetical protein
MFFLWQNFGSVVTIKTSAIKGCFLGERKKQKSPYFEEKKKSHGAI